MDYFLCIFLPPVAVLIKGRPGQFILNCLLCLLGWFPAVIHAFIVVNDARAQQRQRELMQSLHPAYAYGTPAYGAPAYAAPRAPRPVQPPVQLNAQTSLNLRAEGWVRQYAAAHPVATWSVAAASALFIAVVMLSAILN
jgi:uncharacterized membrane protein YqaE (UPF0057 family)